jgi:dTDP-4-dehydrorhamnose reductase
VVNDQVVTPTYTVDLARAVSQLIRTEAYGLYHITAAGSCTWFEFAREIFELTGVSADLQPVTAKAFGAPARRPAYSVLRNGRLEAMGSDDLPGWENGLRRYLAEREKALGAVAAPRSLREA